MWGGDTEASAIVRAWRNVSTPHSIQVGFITKLLQAARARVIDARITTLNDKTFKVSVTLQHNNSTSEVGASPSDALTIAAHITGPIVVNEAFLATQGKALSEAQRTRLGRGLVAFGKRLARAKFWSRRRG